MSQSLDNLDLTRIERLRARFGGRAIALVLALVLEALLLLLLLTLGRAGSQGEPAGPALASFDISGEVEEAPPEPAEQSEAEPTPVPAPDRSEPEPDEPAPAEPAPPQPAEPAPAPSPSPAAIIPLGRDEMIATDITPRQNRPQTYGPADTGRSGAPDSQRVGTAPNGEPLYAARWYREPRDGELTGYLSTASGPGWGLIACKTAPDYRVEQCVELDEYPAGSNIGRSVLAAAWQFRVRPPRLGGRDLVGEWVRIRIDYDLRQR